MNDDDDEVEGAEDDSEGWAPLPELFRASVNADGVLGDVGMKPPPDGTAVTALTYESHEYDRAAERVSGPIRSRWVDALKYWQCWVNGVQVDPASVREVEREQDDADPEQTFEKALVAIRDRGGRFVRRERFLAAAADPALANQMRSSIEDPTERLAFDTALWAAIAYTRAMGTYEAARTQAIQES